MLDQIDLRQLSELSSSDRAFLSVYLAQPDSWEKLQKRVSQIKKLLSPNGDELEQFQENIRMVENYLNKPSHHSGGLCIFACWLLDYFQAYPLDLPIEDTIWVGSSPYIRPLAELKDEYENFAVVLADNTSAKIYVVASGKMQDEKRVRGNIKNHVKVGGWSQQRYERRRDKELLHYAKDIVERLQELDKNREFDRVILAGSEETVNVIKDAMPQHLKDQLIGTTSLDLDKGDDYIEQELFDIFWEEEWESEEDLWTSVKNRYMAGGLAVVGVDDLLPPLKLGRVETVIVNRDAQIEGRRCRDCENVFNGTIDQCPICGSNSLFAVDIINEIAELVKLTSAEIEFAHAMEPLKKVGDVAGLLRY